MGLKTGIWASRLEFGPRDWDLRGGTEEEQKKKEEEKEEKIPHMCNSRKSVRWSAVPVPCLSRLWFKLRGEQGSGPEGVDDLCFHTYGGFSPSPSPPPTSPPSNPSLEAQIPVSRPKSQSRGPNPSLEAQILASRPKS